jgi:hypothetical protein
MRASARTFDPLKFAAIALPLEGNQDAAAACRHGYSFERRGKRGIFTIASALGSITDTALAVRKKATIPLSGFQ